MLPGVVEPKRESVGYASPVLMDGAPWLAFSGHWGERSDKFGFDSPVGPAHQKEKWDTPVKWAQSLPDDHDHWDRDSSPGKCRLET